MRQYPALCGRSSLVWRSRSTYREEQGCFRGLEMSAARPRRASEGRCARLDLREALDNWPQVEVQCYSPSIFGSGGSDQTPSKWKRGGLRRGGEASRSKWACSLTFGTWSTTPLWEEHPAWRYSLYSWKGWYPDRQRQHMQEMGRLRLEGV